MKARGIYRGALPAPPQEVRSQGLEYLPLNDAPAPAAVASQARSQVLSVLCDAVSG